MAFVNAQQARILYGSQAISSVVRSVQPTASRDMLEVTTLADTGKAFVPGLVEWQLSVDGVFDNATGAGTVFEQMTSPLTSATTVATSIAPSGFTAGNAVWLIPAKTVTYEVGAQVSNAVEYSLALGAASTPGIGISLVDLAAVTATGNGASQDNAAASTNGFLAQLHVTAVSGTTPNLTAVVQQSTNNSTWTTLGSFTAATAIGSEAITGTGTVNRYLRISWTVTGTTPSFTAQVSIVRF